jgi:hypothetical protein
MICILIDNRALSYHLHHTNPSTSSVTTINSSRVFIHYSSHSVAACIIIIEVTVRINVEGSFKGRHLFRVRDLIYVPTADL